MLQQRLPDLAAQAVDLLQRAEPSCTCLDEVKEAAELLSREGFVDRPSFQDLLEGARPRQPSLEGAERGEWPHGWQYFAAAHREHRFRDVVVLPALDPAGKAHLRSHGGPHASCVLVGAPTSRLFEVEAADFRNLVLERLGLPLSLTDSVCEGCGAALDGLGRHRGACMRSGRLKIRAGALERAMAHVCREAGATVRSNVRVADLNLTAPVQDERRIDVLAQNLPGRSKQVAVDVTVRSALTSDGLPVARAAWDNGAAAGAARADKEGKYPDLVGCARCDLVVFALETGGRWDEEAVSFVRDLAAARAADVPLGLRFATTLAYERRWARWLSTASAVAFIRSLTLPKAAIGGAPFAPAPSLPDLLASGPDGGALGPPVEEPVAAVPPACPAPPAAFAYCLPFACSSTEHCGWCGVGGLPSQGSAISAAPAASVPLVSGPL